MVRTSVLVTLITMLCACATTRDDYALQWDDRSAVLHVHAPNGEQLLAFGSQLLSLPGYMFSQGAINMHPGEAQIGYDCPRPDGFVVLDAIPTVSYVFQAGKVYDLRCNQGTPQITERHQVPNNAFKPNSFRYANNMAERACHVLGSATRVGLTQALGLTDKSQGLAVLTKGQANATSEVLLADRRKKQAQFAETIATKFVPFSTLLRYGITGTTGVLIGVMFGSGQPGGIFLWSVIGLGVGTVVSFWLGRIRSRREA